MPDHVFTGRTRARRPQRSVLVADRAARWVIALGGIGSILAVSLVGLFLLWVALPLLRPARTAPRLSLPAIPVASLPALSSLDEYATMAWTLHRDGSVLVRRLTDGQVVDRRQVPSAAGLTCWSVDPATGEAVLGYADGSVRLGRIGFTTTFVPDGDAPPEVARLARGAAAPWRGGVVQRTPEDQLRLQQLAVEFGDSVPVSAGPIALVDRGAGARGAVVATLDAAGTLHVSEVRERANLLTGEVTATTRGGRLDLLAAGVLDEAASAPAHLLLSGLGDNVVLVWPDGRLVRLDTADPTAPAVAEEVDVVPETGRRLTAVAWLLGRSSLACGDDLGRLRVWFRVRTDGPGAGDGSRLVLAHEYVARGGAPITRLAASRRTRLLASGHADGTVALRHVTSGRVLAELVAAADAPVTGLALSPRDDLLLAIAGGATTSWTLDAPHPEVSVEALVGRVWYEGYGAPAHVWQSSSGTDSFEPKYGLMPLVFGTLKATVYSLLIGLPLAWGAALTTSEFLSPRAKARIKPTIELMASLPSVVLGFLGALVIAPFLERWVPETVLALITMPLCFLAGAHLWQLLPRELALRLGRLELPAIALGIPAGLLLARALGDPVERLMFGGDIMAWLDGQHGSAVGGWFFLLLLPSAALVFLLQVRVVDGWLRASRRAWTRGGFALADLARFAAGVAATLALALAAGGILAAAGLDPRGSVVGTHVQRNALVVGIVMGFAIIPIIYTISEDALSSVPAHLRAASLGAGATPWQTAILVVIPPAASGLFSALMIGLGRAVGETMIVLMAAGNTPIMRWNVFDGFRTLSATIAVELPEAVKDSTHYRTLFLAALCLFALTFVLNTAAEAVRMRFRTKAREL